jgi:hypothetical protein
VDIQTKTKVKLIRLASDFTVAPGGRIKSLGPHSGEAFREDLLRPALQAHDVVVVNLDGALGLPSSFLDEAFRPLKVEYHKGKLKVELTDNPVAAAVLQDCLKN